VTTEPSLLPNRGKTRSRTPDQWPGTVSTGNVVRPVPPPRILDGAVRRRGAFGAAPFLCGQPCVGSLVWGSFCVGEDHQQARTRADHPPRHDDQAHRPMADHHGNRDGEERVVATARSVDLRGRRHRRPGKPTPYPAPQRRVRLPHPSGSDARQPVVVRFCAGPPGGTRVHRDQVARPPTRRVPRPPTRRVSQPPTRRVSRPPTIS
jgi:hypothetical protein